MSWLLIGPKLDFVKGVRTSGLTFVMSYAAYKAFLKKGEPQNTCLESKKNLTHPNLQPMLIAVNLFIQPNRMNYNEYLFYLHYQFL